LFFLLHRYLIIMYFNSWDLLYLGVNAFVGAS